jgi:acyl-CoA synthetase (AMP-forming)/AMP-acid ligase II
MEFGRRLLPQVVDHYAKTEPDRVYASIPRSTTELSDGFEDVSMTRLASIVNRMAWWLEDRIGRGELDAIAYIGPADIRYAAIFLAAVKCGYKVRQLLWRLTVSQLT